MTNTTQIQKSGKSKNELFNCLGKFINSYQDEIVKNNIVLNKIIDGYSLYVTKKILFIKFYVDAKITASDGFFTINYDTNAPADKVNEALGKVREA